MHNCQKVQNLVAIIRFNMIYALIRVKIYVY